MEDLYQKTGFMPPALSRKPDLEFWMTDYLSAFWLLSSRRSYGMAANPISFQDIVSYIQLFGHHDFQEFIQIICLMDEEWILVTAKRKK